MKKRFLLIIVLLAAFSLYWFVLRTKDVKREKEPKTAPITLNTHSDTFNLRVDAAIHAYIGMKDAFVNADTAGAKRFAAEFAEAIGNIPYEELSADSGSIRITAESVAADLKANTASLLMQTDITEMRRDFSALSDQLYPGFVKMINYEGNTLYVQTCPMAFNDEETAMWLSLNDEVVNPYLGKKHPKYKAGMLNCGEVKDSVTRR